MRVGFIGLGNVGSKLAGSLLRNGFDLVVRDLDRSAAAALEAGGAGWAESPAEMAAEADMVITCLPSPAASAAVMEAGDGILAGLASRAGSGNDAEAPIWAEMGTTDEAEMRRLAARVAGGGRRGAGLPGLGRLSPGRHRQHLHLRGLRPAHLRAGPAGARRHGTQHPAQLAAVGSASILKVVTNYLASANLVSLCEALVTSKLAGIDLSTAYEAIRISSGNSFVHETESQVILNGSRDINFTMDLVQKDLSLFAAVAERAGVPLELARVLIDIFDDAAARYGPREWSPNVVRRLEQATGVSVLAPGFPAQMVDDEPEAPGREVVVARD